MLVCIGIFNLLHECEGSTLMSSCLHSRDLVTHLPRASLSQLTIFLKMLIINLLILSLKSAFVFSAHSSLHQSWVYCRDKRLSCGMRWPGFFLSFLFPATRLFKNKPSAAEALEIERKRESLWAPSQTFTEFNQELWQFGPEIVVLMVSLIDPHILESKGLRNWVASRHIPLHCFLQSSLEDYRSKLHINSCEFPYRDICMAIFL